MKARELLEILQNIDDKILDYDVSYSNRRKLAAKGDYFLEKEFNIAGVYVDDVRKELCIANEELMEFVEHVNTPKETE